MDFVEPIIEEDFYVWVAPDGTMQLATMSPDEIMCIAFAKLLHKSGMGQSPHEMRMKGFSIQKVKVTIIPDKKVEAQDIN